jgi:hypothetical protein
LTFPFGGKDKTEGSGTEKTNKDWDEIVKSPVGFQPVPYIMRISREKELN